MARNDVILRAICDSAVVENLLETFNEIPEKDVRDNLILEQLTDYRDMLPNILNVLNAKELEPGRLEIINYTIDQIELGANAAKFYLDHFH